MPDRESLRAAGDRIEQLLGQIGGLPDRRALAWTEELLRLVTDLYGAGLERVVGIGCARGAPAGPELLERLAGDDLVASLLLLHGLHPSDLRTRVDQALESLRPSLGAADVRVLEIDEEAGVVRLRLLAGDGRSGSSASLEQRVRRALEEAAPELTRVEVDQPLPSTLVHLRRRAEPEEAIS
ncbi:MAG: hypothetical protein ACRDZQ_01480 [Acidimicrobiales bacterium]